MSRRQLLESEKEIIKGQQRDKDGSLRCFISGEIIDNETEVEYDHIIPVAKDGESELTNMRIVIMKYNRRKGDQTLYEVRDNLRLERVFLDKKNNIRLQDIFELKEIERKNIHSVKTDTTIKLDDGNDQREFKLFEDNLLGVKYFYGRIPIRWLENDDQEGLQPRVIEYKKLVGIREHLKSHPQLAPSIARLIGNRLKLFDGQHKLAGQTLNNVTEVDLKVYISPDRNEDAKKLFDTLMITNLDAHSKHKQTPFYTSTLLDRLSVIYRELLDEFISTKPVETHNELNFINYLIIERQYTKPNAKELLKSAIKENAKELSAIKEFVAEASRDPNYPISVEVLNKAIFPNTLFLEPSKARFTSDEDFRNAEIDNFKEFANILVEEGYLKDWVPHQRGRPVSNVQLKARRIWHKASVLTWASYLRSVFYFALQTQTNDEREQLLHRQPISEKQKQIIRGCLNRLFSHPFWDEPEGEIDSLLVSAQKQGDLFTRKGLTEYYVLHGNR